MPCLPNSSTWAEVFPFESSEGLKPFGLLYARGDSGDGSKLHSPNKLILFLACTALAVVCIGGILIFLAIRKRMPSTPPSPRRNLRPRHSDEKDLVNDFYKSSSDTQHKSSEDGSFASDEKRGLGAIEEGSEGEDMVSVPKPTYSGSLSRLSCSPPIHPGTSIPVYLVVSSTSRPLHDSKSPTAASLIPAVTHRRGSIGWSQASAETVSQPEIAVTTDGLKRIS